jgi:Flp pilus assembly protein TadG
MSIRRRSLWGDERGGVLVETTLMLGILLIFILGSVDFLMAMYQWNAAGKAVQVGARIAAVSTPVAIGLTDITGLDGGADAGDFPPPSFTTRTCTGAGGGSCTGGSTYDAVAMNRIVYGRVPAPVASMGAASCVGATSSYEIGMCDIFNRVTPANVVVSYMHSGLGFSGRPGGPVPTITVSLQNIPFQFFFLGGLLGFANITIPPLTTTITGEDLSSNAPS